MIFNKRLESLTIFFVNSLFFKVVIFCIQSNFLIIWIIHISYIERNFMEATNIFIHGWSFSSQIWRDYRNIENSVFLDLPFHGDNRIYSEKDILSSFSEEIYKLIEKQDKPVNLIGWSLGASISVLTALKKPKNLEKLILIGFTPKFKDKELGHNPVAIKAFMLALKLDFKDTIYTFRKTVAGDFFKEIPLPEKEGSIKLLKEFIDLDLREQLSFLEVKTFLIHGREDKIISYKGSVYSSKKIKN